MKSILIVGMLAMIVGGPILWHQSSKRNYRNLHIVESGVLYRSGKLSIVGIESLFRQFGIKTIINFRAFESGEQPDADEEAYCKSQGIRYERIVYRKWEADIGQPIPGQQSVDQFLKLMYQRKEIGPILVHCPAGKHRTGAFVAIYRMEYQKWPNYWAIDEMQELGYDGIANEDDVRGFLERYVPRNKQQ